MSNENKIAGMVLAGGLARRMHQQDKGLVLYRDQAMVSYALQALSEVADQVFINANRNIEQYRKFGYPVITDQTDSFDGPLAGVLAIMKVVDNSVLVVMPCDSPLIKPRHLLKLLESRAEADADIAVAWDGARLHPVFLALKTALRGSLEKYLQRGERKIDRWLEQHRMVKVDFSQEPNVFININTLSELEQLEHENHQ